MFWKKKNLKLIYEITEDGQFIVKCNMPKNFNHTFLTSLLLAAFDGNPQIIYGTCQAIKFWGDKKGWPEKADDIVMRIMEEINKKNLQKNNRNPLVTPSEVLNTFRKNIIGKD